MELQHLGHDHPLIFTKIWKVKKGKEVHCHACGNQISDPCYSCKKCYKYSLHKLCAEQPAEMKHHMHPQHTLTLITNPENSNSTCTCKACHEICKGFTYHCSSCGDFDIDIICALRASTIKHKSHEHPLIPIQKPAMFFCHACRRKSNGISYMCTTCQFWIHQDCASLPSSMSCAYHDHDRRPLTLVYSVPEIYTFTVYCKICGRKMEAMDWAYHCGGCRYIAHIKCVTSKPELLKVPKAKDEVEDLEAKLIHLPAVPNESVNLLSRRFKNINMNQQEGENNSTELPENSQIAKETEFNHLHSHPLILSGSEENKSTDEKCDGCMQPISPPFYRCNNIHPCKFFLHKLCGELPTELQHPCHQPQPLTLLSKAPKPFGIFECNGCQIYCNAFSYSYRKTRFHLDLGCASLPSTIKHEGHKHPLILRLFKRRTRCSACDDLFSGFAFQCDTCKNFIVHTYCALLPHSVEHKYDEHPFILTYWSVEGDDEYICEICEEDVNPKWFYHCVECRRSIHYKCIRESDRYSNIKFGGKFKVEEVHSHDLTLVRQKKGSESTPPCGECGERDTGGGLALKCTECDYMIHTTCASKGKKQTHGEKRKRN